MAAVRQREEESNKGGKQIWQDIQDLPADFAEEKDRNYSSRAKDATAQSAHLKEDHTHLVSMVRKERNYPTTDYSFVKSRRQRDSTDFRKLTYKLL